MLYRSGSPALREGFDYPFSRLDPFGDHIDPPSVAVYETVVVKGPDGRAHPGLAEGWTVSPDGLEWRFQIRRGLSFHSGDACDAPAISAALDRLRWGFHGGQQLWYWDPVDTVDAPAPDVLRVTLHHPYARLPSLFWGTHSAIHNERRREADPDGSGVTWADGTGPYRFVSRSLQTVDVERWDGYPGSQAAFLAGGHRRAAAIRWSAVLDPVERVAGIEAGELDCIHGPPYGDVARLEADPRFRVTRHGQAANAYLGLNWERTDLGFDRLPVRRSISLALDRDRIVREALDGYGQATIGPLAPGCEFYDPAVERHRRFDPDEAARLLDGAGWRLDEHGIRAKAGRSLAFGCVIQDDPIHRAIASCVERDLAAIGVRMELEPVRTFAAFYRTLETAPAAFINKWLWQDPVDAALGFAASRGRPSPNWQRASVPALDAAYTRWLLAGSDEDLAAAAAAVQDISATELPLIPLVVPDDVSVASVRVLGWEPHPAMLYPLYQRVTVE